MNRTYFNNNGSIYEIITRYFDTVMLLKSKEGNYIVARWDDIKKGSPGMSYSWGNNKQKAVNDFFNIVYEEYKNDHAFEEQITIEEFKKFYK